MQNLLLYSVGTVTNYCYHLSRFGPVSLFLGMDNWYAVCIIVLNAFMGLAINLVYKYSNAVIKTIASCFSMALLVLASAVFFGAPLSLNTISGTAVIILATYVYMRIALPMNADNPTRNDHVQVEGSVSIEAGFFNGSTIDTGILHHLSRKNIERLPH